MSLFSIFNHYSAYKDFCNLHRDYRDIVIYSEGRPYWIHLKPIIESLLSDGKMKLTYISSSENDPGLKINNPNMKSYCIGEGIIRTIFFSKLKSKILLMTMPDLDTYQIKRSIHNVHYVYIFHSMVSTHMIYRKHAFDAFDAVFCVGPHQIDEIKKHEKMYGLKSKQLLEHGYGRLDIILSDVQGNSEITENNNELTILIAPSWGENALIESGYAMKIIEHLLIEEIKVILRPHPETIKRSKNLLDEIKNSFKGNRNFIFDGDVSTQDSLYKSSIMICDWSGAALDYAFGLEKPVIFVDTPPKVNNSEWEKLGIVPIEDSIRHEIGAVVSLANIADIPAIAKDLIKSKESYLSNIRKNRDKYIFNVGNSGDIGAKYIRNILKNK